MNLELSNPSAVQFSLTAVKRYEPMITNIIFSFPKVVTIDPTPLSNVTYTARLRDAIRGLLFHKYQTTLDLAKLEEIFPSLVVAQRGDKVVAGARDEIGKDVAVAPIKHIGIIDGVFIPTLQQLEATCILLSCRFLTTSITLGGVTEQQLCELKKRFDIEYDLNNDGTYTIL